MYNISEKRVAESTLFWHCRVLGIEKIKVKNMPKIMTESWA